MSRAYGYVESGLVGGIAGAAVSIVNAMASVVSKGMWLAAAAVGLGGVGLGLAGAAKAFELTTSLPFVMEWGTQVAQWGGASSTAFSFNRNCRYKRRSRCYCTHYHGSHYPGMGFAYGNSIQRRFRPYGRKRGESCDIWRSVERTSLILFDAI